MAKEPSLTRALVWTPRFQGHKFVLDAPRRTGEVDEEERTRLQEQRRAQRQHIDEMVEGGEESSWLGLLEEEEIEGAGGAER